MRGVNPRGNVVCNIFIEPLIHLRVIQAENEQDRETIDDIEKKINMTR